MLKKLKKSELRDLFLALKLSQITVENNYAGSEKDEYLHDLLRKWILGKDNAVAATWEHFEQAINRLGYRLDPTIYS